MQPKENDMKKVGAASENNLLMEVPKAATDKELKEEVVDIKNEYGVVKIGAASEEGKPIKSIVEKDTKLLMDDAITIQDEVDVLIGVPTVASEKGLEFVIGLKREYVVSQMMGEEKFVTI